MLVFETCVNSFKRFKNYAFDISGKERSKHLAAVENELRKDGKKS